MNQSAFLFPGQGSQSVGMLAQVAAEYKVIEETFEEASEAAGLALWKLAQEGPESDLNRTENTQPSLLAAAVAMWRLWLELGGRKPDFVAGHSLGEYSALVVAGVLSFPEAVRCVAERGRLMQSAVSEGDGAMAAILGLDDSDVEDVCQQASSHGVVSAANYNSPGQVVISGSAVGVSRAVDLAKQAGARRAMVLAVSVPSHCELMREAARRLEAVLGEMTFHSARIPLVQNVSAEINTTAEVIRDGLIQQLYRPVRWADCIRTLVGHGVHAVAECGPGKVLTGLNRRIDRGLSSVALEPVELMRQTVLDWGER